MKHWLDKLSSDIRKRIHFLWSCPWLHKQEIGGEIQVLQGTTIVIAAWIIYSLWKWSRISRLGICTRNWGHNQARSSSKVSRLCILRIHTLESWIHKSCNNRTSVCSFTSRHPPLTIPVHTAFCTRLSKFTPLSITFNLKTLGPHLQKQLFHSPLSPILLT